MNGCRLLGACLLLLLSIPLQAEIRITDIAGRKVVLQQPAQRFVLSEGRYVLTLALVRPGNPVQGLVGMMQTIGWTYPDLEEQVFRLYPEAKNIALFGARDESSVSVEKIIDLKPEVAILGVQDHGPGAQNAELLRQLAAAGIKVVFIDFRMDPLQNTTRSIAILGQLFGTETRAQSFIDLYAGKRALIEKRLADVKQRPSVFLQVHPGRFDCCMAMADGMLGPFVGLAGGRNIVDALAPGPTSEHTAEFLLMENPDVWIGTASGTAMDFKADKNIVALGAGMTAETARKSLNRFLAAPEFQALDAVKKGRAHALWHDFYNSPLNIAALEAMAQWLHPALFADIDPQRTLTEIDTQFLPFDLNGTFFIGNGSSAVETGKWR